MLSLSTHVLNLANGLPAIDLEIRLYCLPDQLSDQSSTHIPAELPDPLPPASWQLLTTARTDNDGRIRQWSLNAPLAPGIYRLQFDLDSYWQQQQQAGFFPWAELVFRLDHQQSHWHVPLLISPYGLSSYRGS